MIFTAQIYDLRVRRAPVLNKRVRATRARETGALLRIECFSFKEKTPGRSRLGRLAERSRASVFFKSEIRIRQFFQILLGAFANCHAVIYARKIIE